MATDHSVDPRESVAHGASHRPDGGVWQAGWAVAGVAGALGVAFGAFGAHSLKAAVDDPYLLGLWDTAARYHQIHAVALLGVACHPRRPRVAMGALVLGIFLFSGTLYAMALGAPRWLGAVTPFGGTALILGWFSLAFPRRSLA